ncbi:DUF3048 domain-containing protein [Candidatus Saccharibacteria bacterium]|nr:DUF3048 domain-containing protein [Candidatus Saccharibacteria bacterium]
MEPTQTLPPVSPLPPAAAPEPQQPSPPEPSPQSEGREPWHKRKRVRVLIVVSTLLIAAGAVTYWAVVFASYKPVDMTVKKPEAKAPPKKYYSPLTGREMPDEAMTKRTVTAIMVENSPDARPQSGLKEAGVVYEAIAEGGITRFAALYQAARPGLIGPVRSLRPYFVEWITPYNPAIAHVGGSARALEMVRGEGYRDIDQFFNADAYYRSTDRYAPHNVYTTFDRLDALNQSKSYTESIFEGWPRKADAPAAEPNASSINVTISGPLYNPTYTYKKETNSYDRQQGGEAHIDRESGQISPNVVIVMKIPMTAGFEDGYREQMETSGSGAAYIFQDGTVTEGEWQKADVKAPLRFIDGNKQPVKLNAGQTWLTAITTERTVSWQ